MLAFNPNSLRRLRVRAGFSLRQLKELSGVPVGYERGLRGQPTDAEITALADALGVDPAELGREQRPLRVRER